MIRCLRTTRSASSRPFGVRIASFCSPRSIRPSSSRRFSIFSAEARETPSMSTSTPRGCGPPRRVVLADRKREEVDRLDAVVDGSVPAPCDDSRVPRYASVFRLVAARALARPFTYLGNGLEKGTVVSAPFGRAHWPRGLVDTADEKPDGVDPSRREDPRTVSVRSSISRFGCRPLRLDAGPRARARRAAFADPPRRGGAPRAAARDRRHRQSAAERCPGAGSRARAERRRAGLARAACSCTARPGAADRGLLRACEAALNEGWARSSLSPDRAHPQAAARFRGRFEGPVAVLHSRRTRRSAATSASGLRAGRLVSLSAPLGGVRAVEPLGLTCVDEGHDASYKQDGSRLRRAHRRREARRTRERGRRLRQRDPRARAGAARAHGPGERRRPAAAREDRRPAEGTRLPALRAAPRRAARSRTRAARRFLLTAAASPRPSTAALRADTAASTATSRSRWTGTGGCTATTAARRIRRRRSARAAARPSCAPRRGDGAARGRAGQEGPGWSCCGSTRTRPRSRPASPRCSTRFQEADGRPAGIQMVAKGHHFSACVWRRSSTPTPGRPAGLPAGGRTFELVTQPAGRSARDAPGRVSSRRSSRTRARSCSPRATRSTSSLRAARPARSLGYPLFKHLVAIVVERRRATGR